MRCEAKTTRGGRCKRKALATGLCRQHEDRIIASFRRELEAGGHLGGITLPGWITRPIDPPKWSR